MLNPNHMFRGGYHSTSTSTAPTTIDIEQQQWDDILAKAAAESQDSDEDGDEDIITKPRSARHASSLSSSMDPNLTASGMDLDLEQQEFHSECLNKRINAHIDSRDSRASRCSRAGVTMVVNGNILDETNSDHATLQRVSTATTTAAATAAIATHVSIIPWNAMHMVFFSGLRGAVSFACAQIFSNKNGNR